MKTQARSADGPSGYALAAGRAVPAAASGSGEPTHATGVTLFNTWTLVHVSGTVSLGIYLPSSNNAPTLLVTQEHATVELLKREQTTLRALRAERKGLLKRCA